MPRRFRLLNIIIICFIIIFALPVTSFAAPAVDPAKDAKQLEGFADSFMKSAMEKYHVPGVSIVIIKDGKTAVKKGYGYADVEKRLLVDPDRTLFRVGSISKLFTATAVMQLVEQSKIDLNKDINIYLKDFKIESDFKKPVTMANLLTHTGGFDEAVIGMSKKDLSDPEPLGKYLKENMPPVIREPGTVVQYSNHGLGLAGYIVEAVSGIPFEKYVEQNILKPIEMNNSSFVVKNGMLSNISKGYAYDDGKYEAQGLYSLNVAPAGSLVTTSDDMSRFLIAHIKNGKYNEKRILNENTAVDMHKQHFTIYDGMPGFAYGFYESLRGGIRTIDHAGLISPYCSFVSLLPEENTGFFISTNSQGGQKLYEDFANEFYKLGRQDKQVAPVLSGNNFNVDITVFNGIYDVTRRPRANLFKLITLFSPGSDISIKANGKGELILNNGTEQQNFTRISDYLFQNTKDGSYLAFKTDTEGKIYAGFTTNPVKTYEKMTPFEESTMYKIFLLISIISFLIVCAAWIIGTLKKVKLKYKGFSGKARLISNAVSFLNIVFIAGFALYAVNNSTTMAVTPFLNFIMCIPVIATILTVCMIIFTILIWKKALWKMPGRIYYTALTFMAVIFLVALNYGNAIGFNF